MSFSESIARMMREVEILGKLIENQHKQADI